MKPKRGSSKQDSPKSGSKSKPDPKPAKQPQHAEPIVHARPQLPPEPKTIHPTSEPIEEDAAICFVKAYARKPIGVPTSNLIPVEKKTSRNRANAIDWSDAYFYNMMDEPNAYEDSEEEDWSEEDSEYYSEDQSSSAEDSENEDESSEYSESDASSNASNDVDYDDGYDYGEELDYYNEYGD